MKKAKTQTKPPPRALYTKEKARRICEAIAEGGQLNTITRKMGIGRRTVYDWQERHPAFKAAMADARSLHLDYLQDRIRELCATMHEIAASGRETARLELDAAKIEIDAVKWELSKLLPKQYGEKSQMEITGKDGAALLPEHTREQDAAFALVPAVLQKGALVEYGQQKDNQNLRSYIYLAPVQIGKEKCVMAVRIRSSQGQQARFYLHGISLTDELKEKSRGCRDQGSGLGTGNPSGADPRDVFRVAKKAYRVKQKNGEKLQSARSAAAGSAGELLAELTMREYLRPLAAALREAKERGESYAAIKKRLAEPLTNAAALSHGLAATFNAGRSLPQDDTIAAANPYGCNQYGEGWAEPHDGNSTGYQQMGPGKPKRKVLTTEHGGNKVEKVTHEKHPGKGAYEHADNDALDKTAKEEREKREGEKLTAATARTPEELLKATGLPREGEATTEQVEGFLNAMRNRYPENAKRFDELVTNVKTTIPGKAGREAVEHIRTQLQSYMCMISPEVLDQLPQTRIEQRHLSDCSGACSIDSDIIKYDKKANNETLIHEYTHLIHNACEDTTFAEIANYYRERTKNEIGGNLKIGKALRTYIYGKSDHFAPSFNLNDDYAGRIYSHDETKKRTTKDGQKTRGVWAREGVGTEMVTRHLQKLAATPTEFQKHWNDKRDGKYMWREAFLVSMNLLCKK